MKLSLCIAQVLLLLNAVAAAKLPLSEQMNVVETAKDGMEELAKEPVFDENFVVPMGAGDENLFQGEVYGFEGGAQSSNPYEQAYASYAGYEAQGQSERLGKRSFDGAADADQVTRDAYQEYSAEDYAAAYAAAAAEYGFGDQGDASAYEAATGEGSPKLSKRSFDVAEPAEEEQAYPDFGGPSADAGDFVAPDQEAYERLYRRSYDEPAAAEEPSYGGYDDYSSYAPQGEAEYGASDEFIVKRHDGQGPSYEQVVAEQTERLRKRSFDEPVAEEEPSAYGDYMAYGDEPQAENLEKRSFEQEYAAYEPEFEYGAWIIMLFNWINKRFV